MYKESTCIKWILSIFSTINWLITVYQNSLASAVTSFFPPPRTSQNFWIYQGSDYASPRSNLETRNKLGFWICLRFWIYTRVLNMLGLRRVLICLNTEYVQIIPEYIWLYLNTSERALLCQNMLNASQSEVKTFGGSRFKKN